MSAFDHSPAQILVAQGPGQGFGQFWGAAGRGVKGRISAGLGEARSRGGDHRRAAGQGLQDGDAEALAHGRVGEGAGQPVEAGQVGAGHLAEEAGLAFKPG